MSAPKRIKKWHWLLMLATCVFSYPAAVLAFTWGHVFSSDLLGGRHGPLDAYRHTLASAFVSYTLHPQAVQWVTQLMEGNEKRSSIMDRHNNANGARIGGSVQSISEIEPAVWASIAGGQINSTNPQQSTWLPKEDWRQGKLW
jgi:hypothetical protein